MKKPIEGSWFEFQHPNEPEAKYYNAALANFTAEQWEAKVKEAADLGLQYLIHMCSAMYFKAFYDTTLLPKFELRCEDPFEVVLSAADKYGLKFFLTCDYFDDASNHGRDILDPQVCRRRMQCMDELVERYGQHKSFYGWYWAVEEYLKYNFHERYMKYVNLYSDYARKLTPQAKILVAPYGTGIVVPDDTFVKQLDSLDVDIVAYQDEIGCLRHTVADLPRIWEGLRKAHDKVQKAALWADVEIFEFPEGAVGTSALMPAPFERVRPQLEAAGDFCDTILIYQFQGMMNKPGSPAFAGHPSSTRLYQDYVDEVRSQFPDLIKCDDPLAVAP